MYCCGCTLIPCLLGSGLRFFLMVVGPFRTPWIGTRFLLHCATYNFISSGKTPHSPPRSPRSPKLATSVRRATSHLPTPKLSTIKQGAAVITTPSADSSPVRNMMKLLDKLPTRTGGSATEGKKGSPPPADTEDVLTLRYGCKVVLRGNHGRCLAARQAPCEKQENVASHHSTAASGMESSSMKSPHCATTFAPGRVPHFIAHVSNLSILHHITWALLRPVLHCYMTTSNCVFTLYYLYLLPANPKSCGNQAGGIGTGSQAEAFVLINAGFRDDRGPVRFGDTVALRSRFARERFLALTADGEMRFSRVHIGQVVYSLVAGCPPLHPRDKATAYAYLLLLYRWRDGPLSHLQKWTRNHHWMQGGCYQKEVVVQT